MIYTGQVLLSNGEIPSSCIDLINHNTTASSQVPAIPKVALMMNEGPAKLCHSVVLIIRLRRLNHL
jgi:hypothetical protein